MAAQFFPCENCVGVTGDLQTDVCLYAPPEKYSRRSIIKSIFVLNASGYENQLELSILSFR